MKIIIAAGVKASNERATDSGTASGIFILNPVVVVILYTSTANIAAIIPTNKPAEPNLDICRAYPISS